METDWFCNCVEEANERLKAMYKKYGKTLDLYAKKYGIDFSDKKYSKPQYMYINDIYWDLAYRVMIVDGSGSRNCQKSDFSPDSNYEKLWKIYQKIYLSESLKSSAEYEQAIKNWDNLPIFSDYVIEKMGFYNFHYAFDKKDGVFWQMVNKIKEFFKRCEYSDYFYIVYTHLDKIYSDKKRENSDKPLRKREQKILHFCKIKGPDKKYSILREEISLSRPNVVMIFYSDKYKISLKAELPFIYKVLCDNYRKFRKSRFLFYFEKGQNELDGKPRLYIIILDYIDKKGNKFPEKYEKNLFMNMEKEFMDRDDFDYLCL